MKNKILHTRIKKTWWQWHWLALITCYFLTASMPISAHSKIDSLRNRLAPETNDSLRVVTMINLSRALHQKQEPEQEDIEIATQAMELATAVDTITYARAINNLGLLYRFHQLHREAIVLHTKAYELIAHQEGFPLDKMIFANNAGVAGRYNAEYDLAVDYYMKALRIAEQEQSMRNIEIACNGLGNTFMGIPGREDEGFAYLERALDIAEQVGNERGMAIQYLTIGVYHDQRGQHDTARNYFSELFRINDENLKNEKGRGMALKAFGESYLNEGKDLEASRRYFNDALALFRKINDRQQQAYTLLELGHVEMKQQATTTGLRHLERAMTIAEDLHDRELIMAISDRMSELYEARGNHQLALRYYRQADDFRDSINMSNQLVQISALNRIYNLEKKESEIVLLKQEQAIQQMELDKHITGLKNQGIIIVLLVTLSLTLGLLFVLQSRNRKQKRKAEALLIKTENDRIKAIYEKNLAESEILASQMRINPHFLFNCLNSIKYLIQNNENRKAAKYLVMLARFSRIVLETASKPVHALEEELKLIKYYIELEKNRFDDEFCFTVDNQVGDQIATIQLPSLLLQPFVENAIWHGLLPSLKAVKIISITIKQEGDTFLILIDDTGVGRQHASHSPKEHKSRGTEINNKRIELYNNNGPNSIRCEYIDKKDAEGNPMGTCVIIHIKTTNYDENCHT